MKMRFDTECRRCRKPLRFGTRAIHVFGGYWHNECWLEYSRYRKMRKM